MVHALWRATSSLMVYYCILGHACTIIPVKFLLILIQYIIWHLNFFSWISILLSIVLLTSLTSVNHKCSQQVIQVFLYSLLRVQTDQGRQNARTFQLKPVINFFCAQLFQQPQGHKANELYYYYLMIYIHTIKNKYS